MGSPNLTQAEVPAEVRQAVSAEISNEPCLVYSKSYCPHCNSTKALLSSYGVKAKIVELNVVPDGAQQQAALYAMTKQRTVPNIFIGGKHIGGNDAIQQLARSSRLKGLLDEAGVPNTQ